MRLSHLSRDLSGSASYINDIEMTIYLSTVISVVIPTYNSAQWIKECIESALQFDEVGQVIIVDDGSTDNTGSLIEQLSQRDGRIEIYTHPNQANLGRSASRNLGIQRANQEWIAFLDADDYYLPNRFDTIDLHGTADGYYGFIQTKYEGKDLQNSFPQEITGISDQVLPRELFIFLTDQTEQYFSIISLIVKKTALEQIGGYDENLQVGEDTDLIWRLAYSCILESVQHQLPIAMRRIHGQNTHQQYSLKSKFYKKWIDQTDIRLSSAARKRLIATYLSYAPEYSKRSWITKKLLSYWWLFSKASL